MSPLVLQLFRKAISTLIILALSLQNASSKLRAKLNLG